MQTGDEPDQDKWGYRKNATTCTNVHGWNLKACKGFCGYIVEARGHRYHKSVAKQGWSAHTPPGIQKTTRSRQELYTVPAALVRSILEPICAEGTAAPDRAI